MNRKLSVGTLVVASAFMTMSACGGGSGSGTNDTSASSTTTGPITAFGSVYVNGSRYETGGVDVYIEDELADESELRVGMMVTIERDENGDALTISHDDDLEGLVTATDTANGTLDIMGQTVTITTETIFESEVAGITDVSMIQIGNIVEVSGYSSGMGAISATRIEVESDNLANYLATHSDGIEVKGVVMNHSPADSEFDLGNMTVNYAGAVLEDLDAGIDNGIYVEVKSVQGLVNNILIASVIELEDDGTIEHEGEANEEYEFSGLIMAINGDTITVNGEVVTLTSETEFDDVTRDSLAVGDEVEVEGVFDDAGNLIAHSIEREESESDRIEMSGTIASVTSTDINIGSITLEDGNIILVNNDTLMHDSRDVGMVAETRFNLSDLASGDYIEIYVTDNGDGTFTAVRLEREDIPEVALLN